MPVTLILKPTTYTLFPYSGRTTAYNCYNPLHFKSDEKSFRWLSLYLYIDTNFLRSTINTSNINPKGKNKEPRITFVNKSITDKVLYIDIYLQ